MLLNKYDIYDIYIYVFVVNKLMYPSTKRFDTIIKLINPLHVFEACLLDLVSVFF